jgi:uroporphyrin-III C-methyltransferase/precorrin-2 dehydrogenase/sirohydrochlorin ferrochelatase/uroporphyrin-III C-methyltransferase
MGLSNLQLIARQLIQAGLPADTPALAVQDGTLPQQRRVFGPLRELPQRVARAGMAAPLLAIVGRTVALADELDWYIAEDDLRGHGHVAALRGLSA